MVPCHLPISAAANAALPSSLPPPALPPDRDREREREREGGRRFSPFFSVAPFVVWVLLFSSFPLGCGRGGGGGVEGVGFFSAAAEAAAKGDRRRFLRKSITGANSKTMEKAEEDMA